MFLFIFNNKTQAAFNEKINYQGKLTSATNQPVADGNYDMSFRLYTVASGGIAVWTETWNSGTAQVNVVGGIFSALLGTHSSLSAINFNQTLYLGVTINTDSEMTPRKPLGAVPAAFEAKQLNGFTWDNPGVLGAINPNSAAFTNATFSEAVGIKTEVHREESVLFLGSRVGGFNFFATDGNPEGVITSDPGGLASDTVNGVLYVKESGSDVAGWNGLLTSSNGFVNGGNSFSLFNLSAILGTNNAQPLVFETNNVEAMRIGTTGNIGLGEVNPQNKLVLRSNDSVLSIFSDSTGSQGLLFGIGAVGNEIGLVNLRNDGVIAGADITDDDLYYYGNSILVVNDGNVGVGTTTPSDKLSVVHSTDSLSNNALRIDYTQESNRATINGAGLYIRVNSSGDSDDSVYGVRIADSRATDSMETAMSIGRDWDTDLELLDATPNIKLEDRVELAFKNTTGNNLIEAKDLNTNFGMALSAGAFMDRNSSLQEEFNAFRTNRTADYAGGVNAYGFGDNGGWGVYTSNTGVTFSTPSAVNGIARTQVTTLSRGGLMMLDQALNSRRNILDADNLPVLLMKVKPGAVGVNNKLFIGMGDATDGTVANPANFIGFTNTDTTWTGRTSWADPDTTDVTCAGQTISTTNYALLMVEVRSITDVRFYVDNNVSDGVNFTYCGASTDSNTIPLASLAPEIIYQARTGGTTTNAYLDVDFYRAWQDDVDTSKSELVIAKTTKELLTQAEVISDIEPVAENGEVVDDSIFDQYGNLQLEKLIVNSDTDLRGALIIAGDLSLGGGLQVLGQVEFNQDTVGQAIIKPAASEVKIIFTKEYSTLPIITASPFNFDGRWKISNLTKKDFVIKLSEPASEIVLFNWHAFASNDKSMIFSSEGVNEQLINQFSDLETELGQLINNPTSQDNNTNNNSGTSTSTSASTETILDNTPEATTNTTATPEVISETITNSTETPTTTNETPAPVVEAVPEVAPVVETIVSESAAAPSEAAATSETAP